MSAYICSDKHIATIVKAVFAHPRHQQTVANALKRENIRSVNYRYKERTRVTKCNLDEALQDEVNTYTGHDILKLLDCLDYQSCEHPDYDDSYYNLINRLLSAQGSNAEKAKPNLWSI